VDESVAAAGFVARDSAGIAIVENQSPAWEPGLEWTVGPLETAIGEVEGAADYQLYYVFDATRLADGTVAVANSGTSEIRLFDLSGRFIRTVGRVGSGPGEFRANLGLRALGHWDGDTLYAWDLYAQTLSVFSPEGGFVRSNRLRNTNRMYFMSRMSGGGLFGDKTMALASTAPIESRDRVDGLQSPIVRYVRFSAEGDSLLSLGDFTGSERFVRYGVAGQSMTGTAPPFGRTMTARTAVDRQYVAAGIDYEVAVYRPDASLEMLIRKAHQPVAVTGEMRDWAKEQELAELAAHTGSARAMLSRDYAEMPQPEVLPPYRSIEVDVHSNLWVQEYNVGDRAPNEWSVFDRTGVWLGTVVLPAGVEVYEIGDDYVLGKVKDELEVEHVVVYTLVKSER
jgi:hypothetical protein